MKSALIEITEVRKKPAASLS